MFFILIENLSGISKIDITITEFSFRMKIYIKTFGCTANRADSHRIVRLLSAEGHTFIDSVDMADLVVVNTCTVTETTQRNVLKYLHSIGPERSLIVAGCLPAAQPGKLNGIDCLSITPSSLDKVVKMIESEGQSRNKETPVLDNVTGIVSISSGCTGECSYCIVKSARGELESRPVNEIVMEVRQLLELGAKEIQLTSQDTSAYGLDTGQRLPELLQALTSLEGDHMVRVGMMNPFTALGIIDDLVDSFRDPRIFKFLHLPVQSGSDKVLEDMKRNHTAKEFRYIVERFRNEFPDMTLSTDIIVGYPTESDMDFRESVKLLDEIRPHKINITQYSPRPGTPASKLHDMPGWKKKDRSRIISKQHRSIGQELSRKKIGETVRILITEAGKNNSTIGRDLYYNNIVVREELPPGNWYVVKIIESRPFYLIAEKVDDLNN